ncbi:MAG: endonuclease domain-containing protein [Rickettsiales bacterium]|nr:endonuclease domain-containing protein [Rickettsiales bacterium]
MKFDKPNKTFRSRACELRNHSTLSEVLLWNKLKNQRFSGIDFDRQKVINNRYIVDFYCSQYELVIEIDGLSHDNKYDYDKERHDYLTKLGLQVLHISDLEVKTNMELALNRVRQYTANADYQ